MGWLDAFLPAPQPNFERDRRDQWPEQYVATLDEWAPPLAEDAAATTDPLVPRLRPMLARTQLAARPLALAYDAAVDGWGASRFHAAVDTKGAAVVWARCRGTGAEVGAYNPKGWASMGNARPSPAAFLFVLNDDQHTPADGGGGGGGRPTKVRAASHIGCNSISSDTPNRGIDFGVEALSIPLREDDDGRQGGSVRTARSKLGVYFEKRSDGSGVLWGGADGSLELDALKVFVGVYAEGEDYPYAGAVMDMTSG